LTQKKNQALDEKPLIKGEMEELETRWKNIYYLTAVHSRSGYKQEPMCRYNK